MLGQFFHQISPEGRVNYYGGDLNFSLGATKVWDSRERVDPQPKYFFHKLVTSGSVDIKTTKVKSYWRNMTIGEDRNSNVSNSVMDLSLQLRQWVAEGGESYHFPIFLEVRRDVLKHVI